MKSELVFSSSRWKALWIIAGSAPFVWYGATLVRTEPLLGWAGILLFGATGAIGIVSLVSGGSTLVIDDDGFEMGGAFGTRRHLWTDIESMRIDELRGNRVIAINFRRGHASRSRVSRTLTDMDTCVGNIYSTPLEDMLACMQARHAARLARAVKPAAAGTPPAFPSP